MSALGHTLTFVREQDQRERGDKVVPHRIARPEAPVATGALVAVTPLPAPASAPALLVEPKPLIVQSA
jgi:hypothetical protein